MTGKVIFYSVVVSAIRRGSIKSYLDWLNIVRFLIAPHYRLSYFVCAAFFL